MPIYPQDAIARGTSVLLQVKIAIDDMGRVARIRVKPRTAPMFKSAAAEAVKQWEFKPRSDGEGMGKYSMSRLTFSFAVRDGIGQVELYNPGPSSKDSERLGYSDSIKELNEWGHWEEVPIKK